ncbi:hypothetical protein JW926_01140 [Candidatus Sumerlaeota bacterium]|nr:hypothetical protein [Candidatus Sumerlaeota bacterium]
MVKDKKSVGASKDAEKNQKSTESQKDAPQKTEAASLAQKNLYEKELEKYRVFLQYGFDVAYKYYGFSLFHSLTAEEKVETMQKLGFEPRNPEDFYNLGCLAAQKDDYVNASKFFQKTIEMAPDFEEAYYNLAISQENLGEEKEAIENWETYSEFLEEDSSEALLISQRIEELKSSHTPAKKKDSK